MRWWANLIASPVGPSIIILRTVLEDLLSLCDWNVSLLMREKQWKFSTPKPCFSNWLIFSANIESPIILLLKEYLKRNIVCTCWADCWIWRPIHTERKWKRKRKLSLMLVVLSFARCEQAGRGLAYYTNSNWLILGQLFWWYYFRTIHTVLCLSQ